MGANLARMIYWLWEKRRVSFFLWVDTIRKDFPEVNGISVSKSRKDSVLSWRVEMKDGTVVEPVHLSDRFVQYLGGTILGFLPEEAGRVWLIARPEDRFLSDNMEPIFRALSLCRGQVLLATSSPAALECAQRAGLKQVVRVGSNGSNVVSHQLELASVKA